MNQNIAHNRKADKKTLICVLLLALIFILLLWRVPLGYDWTDEQYYSVVAYRLLQGDRPLIDTWEVHQFSGMLAAPVLGEYRYFNGGSMDGCVLFLRYFYVSVQFLASLLVYFSLRKASGHLPALLAAGMMLAYAHFSINSYYYDSMAYLFTILAAVMLFRAQEHPAHARAYAALSGVAAALATIAFPYALAALLVCFVCWIIDDRKNRQSAQRRFGALWFIAGAALAAGAVAAFILSRATLQEVIDGARHMLSDPDHLSVGILRVAGQYFNAIRVIYSPYSYLAVVIAMAGAIYRLSKTARVKQALRLLGAVLALAVIAGVTVHILTYDISGIYRINLLAPALALIAPGLWLLADCAENRAITLFAIGCALSLSTQIGSNTRILASSGMLLPASMAAALYLSDHARAIFSVDETILPRMRAQTARRFERALTVCAYGLTAAFVLSLCALRLAAIHRDEPVEYLTATIESGAAKGIRTTPESAERHREMVREIRENAPADGSILFTYLFPEGYLITGLKAATPSAFNMAMDSSWLAAYYQSLPERAPVAVFALNPDLPYNESSMSGADDFAREYGLTQSRLTYMTVYLPADTQ